jgi:hypothetical protein
METKNTKPDIELIEQDGLIEVAIYVTPAPKGREYSKRIYLDLSTGKVDFMLQTALPRRSWEPAKLGSVPMSVLAAFEELKPQALTKLTAALATRNLQPIKPWKI